MKTTEQNVIGYLSDNKPRFGYNLARHFNENQTEMTKLLRNMAATGLIRRTGGQNSAYVIPVVKEKKELKSVFNSPELKRDPWVHMRACIAARNPEKGMV